MQGLIFVVFTASLLIATFTRPGRLNRLSLFVWLGLLLGVTLLSLLNNDKHSLTPFMLLEGALLWGLAVAGLLRFVWAGPAQVTFQSSYHLAWLNWLISAFFLAFASGSIGYAFASNIAITYAKNLEAAQILYDRSVEGGANGFLFLSLAAVNVLVPLLLRPALTNKGLRADGATLVRWDEIDSYEWLGDKLIVRRKISSSRHLLSGNLFLVNPAEQGTAKRILTQYLPNKQVQPSPPAQATA